MKFVVNLVDFFSKGNPRTVRAKINITISLVTKGISLLISFLIVPITLGYVGKVEYGIWMTISAIIQWFYFFDIGFGSGLRNKLAEAFARNEQKLAKVYISSAFAMISALSVSMYLIFWIASKHISWNAVLNTDLVPNAELLKIVTVVFFFFCVEFILNIVFVILRAMQLFAVDDIVRVSSQILGLVSIFFLIHTTESNLFYLCMVYGGKSAVVFSITSVILFSGRLKDYRPEWKYVNIKKAYPIIHLGLKFFVTQILTLVISRSSVILVVQFFGPEDVTVFNLAVRYATIISILYGMTLIPFITAFTEAYVKGEFDWIEKIMKKINLIWLLASLGTVVLVLFSNAFFKMWVGDKVIIPASLVLILGVYSVISAWENTYTIFLNGIGKIRLQLIVLIIQVSVFFPLSYILYKKEFGLASIVIAQIILYAFSSIIYTIQYRKIINQKAFGIWNK